MILPSSDSSSAEDLAWVTGVIAEQSEMAQVRIAITAQILRDLLKRDVTGESLLAFTLVMFEVAGD